MNYIKLTALFIFFSVFSNAQTEVHQDILDSIVMEADLLYKYEKIAWNATDLLMANPELKMDYGGYVIYHSSDTITASFIDKTQENRIAKYSFTFSNLNEPFEVTLNSQTLDQTERLLLDVKINIIKQLSDPKYEVAFPEGYSPNLVLLREPEAYKLYLIMGTGQSHLIPFGNDYLFQSDLNGTITSWRKFHSRIIPLQTKLPTGDIVLSGIHSHLQSTPYISATDICTFRLYASLYGMKEFIVLSTALDKKFKYNIDSNSIEVMEK